MNGKTLKEAVRSERDGDVALLVMDLAPVNALVADLRHGLRAALDAALADPEVRAVVICSDTAHFSAGADLADLGKVTGQSLADLCLRIEASAKPVVAAINGKALGVGLELALAAHARVCSPEAAFGLPDVVLGTVPGAGGTQRLPRLVGAQAALRLLLDPSSVSAAQALAIGLVDEVAQVNLRAAAVALAQGLTHGPLTPSIARRDGLRDGRAYHAAVVAARARLMVGHLPAPQRAIDCVEAAQLLSPEQGLAYENAAFQDLVNSPQAQGLRHLFLAERRAGMPSNSVAAVGAVKLSHVGIWGADPGMAELALQALSAGLRVSVVDGSREAMTLCLSRIATLQERAVTEGRQSADAREADWARLQSTSDPAILAQAELIFASSDAGPVPLNAASSVLIGALPPRAAAGRVALAPAMATGLVAEICQSAQGSVSLVARVMGFARMLGWRVVFTGPGGPVEARLRTALSGAIADLESRGVARPIIAAALGSFGIGVGGRASLPAAPPEAPGILQACLAVLANQGARLLTEGVAARPSDIDAVAVLSGLFPRWQGGPMFQADRLGLLVLRAQLRQMANSAPQLYEPAALLDRLIAEGQDFSSLDRAG